jgi:hypothetical protein
VSAFSRVTAFRFVRNLAVEQSGAGMYLLVYSPGAQSAVEEDLLAEVQVQLGVSAEVEPVSAAGLAGATPTAAHVRILKIDQWFPDLIALLDTHVVRLEKMNVQFLFLVAESVYEQLLTTAPNFRSRLMDIAQIIPEDAAEGVSDS